MTAVVIPDPDLACKQNDCNQKAFYLELQPVKKGVRALYVHSCDAKSLDKRGGLLTNQSKDGPPGVLFSQLERPAGEGMWEQIKDNGEYRIQFLTEAAGGILSFKNGQYLWEENPD